MQFQENSEMDKFGPEYTWPSFQKFSTAHFISSTQDLPLLKLSSKLNIKWKFKIILNSSNMALSMHTEAQNLLAPV